MQVFSLRKYLQVEIKLYHLIIFQYVNLRLIRDEDIQKFVSNSVRTWNA